MLIDVNRKNKFNDDITNEILAEYKKHVPTRPDYVDMTAPGWRSIENGIVFDKLDLSIELKKKIFSAVGVPEDILNFSDISIKDAIVASEHGKMRPVMIPPINGFEIIGCIFTIEVPVCGGEYSVNENKIEEEENSAVFFNASRDVVTFDLLELGDAIRIFVFAGIHEFDVPEFNYV